MIDHENSSNVVWHNATVTRQRREQQNGHFGGLFWFTGLSGPGNRRWPTPCKSDCIGRECRTFALDGGSVRRGSCADLDYSEEGRAENIRRIGHMAMLYAEAGIVALTAFISPFRADRDKIGKIAGAGFHEIYCKCSLEVCQGRDVKGLYKPVRAGQIPHFTGISSPYEETEFTELTGSTENRLDDCIHEDFVYFTNSTRT